MGETLDTTLKFDELELVKYLKQKESPFLKMIKDTLDDVKNILDSRIPVIFPNYTMHDTGHSFRIIRYMGKLVEDYTQLSDIEIALLICSALTHDVGMGTSELDIEAIRSDRFEFCDTKYSSMLRLMDNDHVAATQEYVRRIHAELSGRYVRTKLNEKLSIPGLPHLNLAEELALICESHTRDHNWMKTKITNHEIRGDYAFNPQFIACILRVADILDIDANRTPYKLYELVVPRGQSDTEWKQHFDILNNEKIVKNDKTGLREIYFYGKSKSADIHRKILTYIDWVEVELNAAIDMVVGMKDIYDIRFDKKVRVDITTEGYTFSGYKIALQFEPITNLLMGSRIYGDRQLGLRELIQNSIDACRVRQELEVAKLGEEPYFPSIRIILDQGSGTVTIKDDGVGMKMEVIKKHFLSVGVSYYDSFDFRLKDLKYDPIGHYGIGFLSAFMLSENVKVRTRHFQSRSQYTIQLEKGKEWTSLTERDEISFFGTEVTLNYNSFMSAFQYKTENVRAFLTKFFLTDGITIKIYDSTGPATEIKNLIREPLKLEKGMFQINFSDYLDDIDGYAIIRKHTDFIRNFGELNFDGRIFLYNPYTELDEYEMRERGSWPWLINPILPHTVNIDEFFNSSEIQYLAIPIVTREMKQEFTNGMKFTDDNILDVIERLEDKLEWLNIILPSQIGKQSDDLIDGHDEIINGVSYDDLVHNGHVLGLPTYKFVRKIKLFEGTKNSIYIPYKENDDNYWYSSNRSLHRQELFIRNVLIKDFGFNMPYAASIFDVSTIVVNVQSRMFIPDISRNRIDHGRQEINYLIGKAIHSGAIDILDLSLEEKEAMQKFLGKYYQTVLELEKK